jgi:hypothetical protein
MTGYALREGLSFCRTGDRFVFLDLHSDRYFCLSPNLDRALLAVVEGARGSASGKNLRPLIRDGILREIAADERLLTCIAPAAPRVSLIEQPAKVSSASILGALSRRLLWRGWVATRPLGQILTEFKRRKQSTDAPAPPPAALIRLAAAHHRAGLIVSAYDQCLSTSLAIASALLKSGASPDIVLGVKLHPFQAHCWVQIGDAVANDRPETVRLFTPILVV